MTDKVKEHIEFFIFYTYFYCFRIEHTAQEVSSKVINKSITHSIFRIQSEDSVMCRFIADSINVLL